MKKKVLMLSCGYREGHGVATVTRELSQSLNAHGDYDVDVLTYWPWQGSNNFPFEHITADRTSAHFRSLDEFIASEQGNEKYDVIQFHNNIFSDYFLKITPQNTITLEEFLKRYDALTISLTHSMAAKDDTINQDPTHFLAERQVMSLSDVLIHLTEEQRQNANRCHPHWTDKTTVIGNGTYIPSPFSNQEIQQTRDILGRRDQKLGLYLGRLSSEKGITELVPAVRDIKQQHPSFKLIIAGNKNDAMQDITRSDLQRYGLREYEDYQFMGWITDLREKQRIIAATDMTIMPSHYEHFPMAALETMVQGKPLIITDIEGPRSAFKLRSPHKRLAYPIERTKDVSSIVEAVTYALEHPTEMNRIGERAQQEVLDKYTWEKIAQKYVSLFDTLLENKRQAASLSAKSIKVGIVVPTYNRKEYIDQNIDSLLNQDFTAEYRIVIVDDGSTDGTFEHLLERYKQEIRETENLITGEKQQYSPQGKIIVIRQENKHVSAARNVGFQKVYELGCEHITHQDSDDIALPHKIRILSQFLDTHPTLGLVHAKSHTITPEGIFLAPSESPWERYYNTAWWDFNGDGEKESMWEMAQTAQWKPGDIEKQHYIHNHTPMYTRQAIEALGINSLNDEKIKYAEDWDFHKRLETAGVQFGFHNSYVAISRYHTKGITGKELKKKPIEEILKQAQQQKDPLEKAAMYTLIREKSARDLNQILPTEYKDDLWNLTFQLNFERQFASNYGNHLKALRYAHILHNVQPTAETEENCRTLHEVAHFSLSFERDLAYQQNDIQTATLRAKQVYTLNPTTENSSFLRTILQQIEP